MQKEETLFTDLRHTCAILALQNGMDTRELSRMLGHTRTTRTRQNYANYLRQPASKEEEMPDEASHAELKQAAGALWTLLRIYYSFQLNNASFLKENFAITRLLLRS